MRWGVVIIHFLGIIRGIEEVKSSTLDTELLIRMTHTPRNDATWDLTAELRDRVLILTPWTEHLYPKWCDFSYEVS